MKAKLIKLAILLDIIYLAMSFIPMTLAQSINNEDLMTRVVLDTSMKPDNSPGVIIDPKTLKNAGAETAFANYMLQVLAGGLITVAAPVAIIIIAIAGLFAVVSHGDSKLIDRAKKTLTWAVIGLVIIIFSWVIVKTTIEVVLTVNNSPTSQTSGQTGTTTTPSGTSEGGVGTEAPATP